MLRYVKTAAVTVGLVLVLAGITAPSAMSAKRLPPPTLAGEIFTGVPTFSSAAPCNPDGTSTFTYTVSGRASGPYPGTFTETGTVTVGRQTTRQSTSINIFDVEWQSGALTELQATFTIDSPNGAVTGTKAAFSGAATCADIVTLRSDFFSGTEAAFIRHAQPGGMTYTAAITTPKRTYCDRGDSETYMAVAASGTLGQFVDPTFGAGLSSTLDKTLPVRDHRGC